MFELPIGHLSGDIESIDESLQFREEVSLNIQMSACNIETIFN